MLANALNAVSTSGEHRLEAELYRLKGGLLVQGSKFKVQGLEVEAEACFQQAIDIARRQSAKSLELRAVIGLSRLWQRSGKAAEARQLLAEVYGWFTEGFGTADLQEARALLTDLK